MTDDRIDVKCSDVPKTGKIHHLNSSTPATVGAVRGRDTEGVTSMQSKRITRSCPICGTAFMVHACLIARGGGKYCSGRCFHVASRGSRAAPLTDFIVSAPSTDDSASVPVYGRQGICAHAIVDAKYAAWANQWHWHLHGGYAARTQWVNGRSTNVWLHREVLGITYWSGLEGDHLDHDRLNDRLSNLRVVTHALNSQNKPSYPGSSRFRGVSWNKANQRWHAYVQVDGKMLNLGLFDDEEDAARVASEARKKHLPFSFEVPA